MTNEDNLVERDILCCVSGLIARCTQSGTFAEELFEAGAWQRPTDDPDAFDDVYEHWVVSQWLGEKLRERDEVVFEFCDMTIWGRCTTGQSISMDGVIRAIADEFPLRYERAT